MVLKRKFILFFSIILFNFIGVANPYIDGIEGYKVSPITINTSEDYYLINESCNISGSQNIQIASRINKSGEFIYDRVTPDFLYNNIINGKMVLLRDGFLCYLSAIQENKKGN